VKTVEGQGETEAFFEDGQGTALTVGAVGPSSSSSAVPSAVPLQRFLGRRETYPAAHRALAGLLSDRAAHRPVRREPSTELVPVSPMTINSRRRRSA
jgi:hypothetical protein